MAETVQYMVSLDANLAKFAVIGKASYLNCKSVSDFFGLLKRSRCATLQVDFSRCTGMDSTFIGMLADIALSLPQSDGKGVFLYNLDGRLLELIENVGLDAILKVVKEPCYFEALEGLAGLENSAANQSDILNAHEKLAGVNAKNASKFKDVIAFLKEQSQRENL